MIAARTAASSIVTPRPNGATKLARSIQHDNLAAALDRIIP
jgi:hypothetical protein